MLSFLGLLGLVDLQSRLENSALGLALGETLKHQLFDEARAREGTEIKVFVGLHRSWGDLGTADEMVAGDYSSGMRRRRDA